jgi:hypothetical protein
MKGKKSALIYCDLIHTVEKLDDNSAGQLFKHFLRYINDQEPETDNLLVEIAFEPIKQSLKRDLKNWESKTESRSKSGQIGNLKRYYPDIYKQFIDKKITFEESQKLAKDSKASQPVAKLADSVSVSVNDSVNVKVIKTILIREAEFKNSLRPYLDKYGKEMLNKFFDYWTEKKPKGKKMRFEMEKVFDIQRRLKTWESRNNNFKGSKENKNEPKIHRQL